MDEGTVGEYNATTGDVINSSFISGLSMPSGLAFFSLQNTLFVADESSGTVRGYDATTDKVAGLQIRNLTDPIGVAVYFPLYLFVGDRGNRRTNTIATVGKYDLYKGEPINAEFRKMADCTAIAVQSVPQTFSQ